jgi:hypothetical protein
MDSYVFELNPVACRILLKIFCACQKHSEFVRLDFSSADRLSISSLDTAGVSILSFQLNNSFFALQGRMEETGNGRVQFLTLGSKHITKAFKNVSPNKILKSRLTICDSEIRFHFYWRNGVESVRCVRGSEPPDGDAFLPLTLSSPSQSLPHIAMSLSAKYMTDLLSLVPDSPALWALTVTHQRDENVSRGSVLHFTNAAQGMTDTSSVVGVTVSHSELNRNSSYFVPSQLPMDYPLRIPLVELKAIASLGSDDTMKECYPIIIGFSAASSEFAEGRNLVTVHMTNSSQSDMSAVQGLSAKLWYKCSAPALSEHTPTETCGDDIDQDDLLLLQAMDAIERTPVQSTPFIVNTGETALIPEWDQEIPSTPSHRGDVLDDLWNS